MKKLTAAMLIGATAVMVITGCGAGGKDIGRDAALEAALEDAGVKESETTRLKVSVDTDDGRKTYEIQFDAGDMEYEYEIQASDGTILSVDTEKLKTAATEQSGNAIQQGNTDQTGTTGQTSGNTTQQTALSMEEAMAIALERVPGATEKDVKIELDYDDGVYKYEGDIIHEQIEYDFEIDANTGTILEWSEERN